MKSLYLSFLVFLLAVSHLSYSQTEGEKENIHLKLVEFSNKYKQLAEFSTLTPATKNTIESNFQNLFLTRDSATVVNDLPIPQKKYGKISVSQYIEQVLTFPGNDLNIIVEVEDIVHEQIFDGINRWYGSILFNKRLSGTIDGKPQRLSLKLKLRVALFNDEFKIISMESPLDQDADGVPDEKDLCRYEPGSVSNSGCPDRDGDGIIDPLDMEPDSKPGVKVDDSGIAKGKFWRNATFSIDFTARNYNLTSPENFVTADYSFTGLWNTDYASAVNFVMNNPIAYFSNHTIDLNTGFSFTSFIYYYKVVEVIDATTTSVLKYKGFDIPREEGKLNYLTIPIGIRLRNNFYYLTLGTSVLIKSNSSSRKGWVYDLKDDQGNFVVKANPQKLDGDDDLTESMNNLPIAPFAELGFHVKLFERFHFKTGINYTYLSGFNKKSDAGAGTVPHFIGLPETSEINLHSISIKVGFTYGISSMKN